jgi:hypothetical protein
MFEDDGWDLHSTVPVDHGSIADDEPTAEGSSAVGGLGVEQLRGWVDALAKLPRDVTDEVRVDRIRVLEELKSAAAAAQARAAADLDASVRARHRALGLPAARQGVGVASQVALARRDSPVKGAQHLGLAQALTREMPHTLAALTAGRLSEWRATLLVRETACLSREDRARVDRSWSVTRAGWRAWVTGRWRPKPAGRPTGSTPARRWPGRGRPRAIVGSPCGRRRTRCRT